MSDTALATIDGEIVERTAPITLFGTDNPTAVVERASAIATALAAVLKAKSLTKHIGNRDHVLVEGWTLLGSMLGVFAEVEWTRPLEDGWEARAAVRTMSGAIVGSGEAMCTRRESTWRTRDDYALRSMAQTRAVSKALRMPLGFIVQLAGYDPTPADEMPDHEAPQARQTAAAPPRARISLSDLRQRVSELGEAHGADPAAVLGKPLMDASIEELIEAGKAIVSGVWDIPFEQPAGETADAVDGTAASASVTPPADDLQMILAATGGEDVTQPEQAVPPVPAMAEAGDGADDGPAPARSPAQAEARAARERLRERR